MHLGPAWVGIGLGLHAIQGVVSMPVSTPIHAITVGGIGMLTLGMMARVSLGHTGRPIRVGALMTVAFLALLGAAAVRVVGPWVWPAGSIALLWTAGLGWAAGFGLFTAAYAPVLLAPRVDGRPG